MNTTRNNTTEFIPPFCPRANCKDHRAPDPSWRYKKASTFTTIGRPGRSQRFTCKRCGGSFSVRTFAYDYWQRKSDLDAKIIELTTSCMSNRQIACFLDVSPTTINRRISRISRHCMLYHFIHLHAAKPVTDVVIDGFVTFELSQYFPVHLHTAVEKGTDFFVYFTDSPVRRGGAMKDKQKKRRKELEETLGKPDSNAVWKDVLALLQTVLGDQTGAILHSDGHKAYRWALKQLNSNVRHLVTSSKDHRGVNNDLWEINLLDLVIRHGSANHKRETIAWSKRRQKMAERLVIFQVHRNYMKGRRVKEGARSPTPAMSRGMFDHWVTPAELFEKRLFRSAVDLPKRWADYYDGTIETVALATNRRHELTYAY